uniref:Uncharacterized protein n=1 Tax=Palpitomonas bilix TaxID=652834 RepID=A0A7S3GI28_9EUKA
MMGGFAGDASTLHSSWAFDEMILSLTGVVLSDIASVLSLAWSSASSGWGTVMSTSYSVWNISGCELDNEAPLWQLEWRGEDAGHASSLYFDNMSVRANNTHINYGSVIACVWVEPHSGHSVFVSAVRSSWLLTDVTIINGGAVMEVVWEGSSAGSSAQVVLDYLHVSASRFSMEGHSNVFIANWLGADSGSQGVYSSTHLSLYCEECAISTYSEVWMFQWAREGSGNHTVMNSTMSAVTLISSNLTLSSVFSALWAAAWSGTNSSLVSNSVIWVVEASTIASYCNVWEYEWGGEGSGDLVQIEQNSLKLIVADSVLVNHSNVFVALWGEEESGQAVSVSSIDSSWHLQSSLVEYRSYFWTLQWAKPGSSSHLDVDMSRLAFVAEALVLRQIATVFFAFWQASSGSNLRLAASNSTWSLSSCTVETSSYVWAYDWGGTTSSQNVVLDMQGSGVWVQNSTFSGFSRLVSAIWVAGDVTNTVVTWREAIFHLVAVDCSVGSALLSVDWVESALVANLSVFLPALDVSSSHLESIYTLFAPAIGGRVQLRGVQASSSSMAPLLSVILLQPQSDVYEDQVLNLEVGGVSIDSVTGISCLNVSSTSILAGQRLDVYVNEVTAVDVTSVTLLSVDGGNSELEISGNVAGVNLTSSSISSFVALSGLKGQLDVHRVGVNGCETRGSLLLVDGYSTIGNLSLYLSDFVLTGHTLTDGSLITLRGRSRLDVGVGVTLGVQTLINPSSLIEMSSAAYLPVMSGHNLTLEVGQGDRLSRAPISLLSFPKGGSNLKGNTFFFSKFSYSPFPSASNVLVPSIPALYECPPGYTFSWEMDISSELYPPFFRSPYYCNTGLNGMVGTSCSVPTFSVSSVCTPCPPSTVGLFRGSSATAVAKVEEGKRYVYSTSNVQARCAFCPVSMTCSQLDPAGFSLPAGLWMPPVVDVLFAEWPANITLDDFILACPSRACNPPKGLQYNAGEKVEKTSMCSAGRDEASPLCSKCVASASVVLVGSTSCAENCRWSFTNIALALAGILLLAGYACFLVLKPLSAKSPWFRLITYYYSVQKALESSTVSFGADRSTLLRIVRAIATLSLSATAAAGEHLPAGDGHRHANNSNSTGENETLVCIPGLQPVDLKLAGLALPALLLSFIFAAFGVMKLRSRRLSMQQLWLALFSVLIVSYSSVTETVLAFISCVSVPVFENGTAVFQRRLFVDASWPCAVDGGWPLLVLVLGLISIFGLPLSLYLWQGLFPSEDRWVYRFVRHRLHVWRAKWRGLAVLIAVEGNLRVWYWDAVLFTRRAVIGVVAVFAEKGMQQQLAFLILNAVFLFHHAVSHPYTSTAANRAELAILLLLLANGCLNFVTLTEGTIDEHDRSSEFLSFLTATGDVQFVLDVSGFALLVVCLTVVYGRKLVLWMQQRARGGTKRGGKEGVKSDKARAWSDRHVRNSSFEMNSDLTTPLTPTEGAP